MSLLGEGEAGETWLPREEIVLLTSESNNTKTATAVENGFLSGGYTNRLSLSLQPGALLPGNSYRFRLQVEDVNGGLGFAEIDIRTATQPTSGQLSIHLSKGGSHAVAVVPLVDRVMLCAEHWTDGVGDTPLLYQFGITFEGTLIPGSACAAVWWLGGVSARNCLSTTLPPPTDPPLSLPLSPSPSPSSPLSSPCSPHAQDTLRVVLRVFDQGGAYSEHSVLYNETSSTHLSFSSISGNNSYSHLLHNYSLALLSEAREDSLLRGDWTEGLSDVTVVLATLSSHKQAFSIDEEQEIKLHALELLLDMFSSRLPRMRECLSHFCLLLQESTAGLVLPAATQNKVLEATELILETFLSFEDDGLFSRRGLSSTDAQALLGIYGNIILANSDLKEERRIRLNSVISSLFQNIHRIGYGLCLQQGTFEKRPAIAGNAVLSNIQASLTNLYTDHEVSTETRVEFGTEVFLEYLMEGKSSGVCLLSVLFLYDLRWSGSVYLSHAKAPIVSLLLVNPGTGGVHAAKELGSQPIKVMTHLVDTATNHSFLECVFWSENMGMWSADGCSTSTVSLMEECVCVCVYVHMHVHVYVYVLRACICQKKV